MPILSKGTTFATGSNPTATTLNELVDNATFVTGAVDNATTQLSGGAIIVKDGGVTPAKLSTGHPEWTTTGALSAAGFLANKGTAGGGVVHVADEGANSYNTVTSRNNANSAYLPLKLISNGFTFTDNGTTGTNIAIAEYTTGAARNWAIRDDNAVDRLRFSRGGTDYAFWDVTKTPSADSVAAQIWYAATSHEWKIGGTQVASIDTDGLAVASGKDLKIGNAYQAGAPTATGYIIIKDSTGTAYKIPAVAV